MFSEVSAILSTGRVGISGTKSLLVGWGGGMSRGLCPGRGYVRGWVLNPPPPSDYVQGVGTHFPPL